MSQIFPETVAASSNGTPCYSKLLMAFRMSQENIYCIYTNRVGFATIFWKARSMFLAGDTAWDPNGAQRDLLDFPERERLTRCIRRATGTPVMRGQDPLLQIFLQRVAGVGGALHGDGFGWAHRDHLAPQI